MVISVINERVFVDDDGLLVTRVIVWESKEISHHLLTARTTTLRDVASFAAPNVRHILVHVCVCACMRKKEGGGAEANDGNVRSFL